MIEWLFLLVLFIKSRPCGPCNTQPFWCRTWPSVWQFLSEAAEGSSRLPPRTPSDCRPGSGRWMGSGSFVSPTTGPAGTRGTSPAPTCQTGGRDCQRTELANLEQTMYFNWVSSLHLISELAEALWTSKGWHQAHWPFHWKDNCD